VCQSVWLFDMYRCDKSGCGGLLRPHVVWFGESLDHAVLSRAYDELNHCDLALVVCPAL